MRLIDADVLIEDIERSTFSRTIKEFFEDFVEDTPTVEAKPVVHAKWDWGVLHKYPMCTNCQLESKDESDFCPNCGAKMDGKKVQDG